MAENLRQELAHVLWIGGATDSGKGTIAEQIAERNHLQLYRYDDYAFAQHDHLAQISPVYRKFINASIDENWLYPSPEELMEWTLQTFRDRFPLVIGDLLSLVKSPLILAEGFGFIPELIMPVLSDKRQALWFISTPDFKHWSMERREKPVWREEASNPERVTHKIYARDLLLATYVEKEAATHGLTVYQVDGSQSIEDMVALAEEHFARWLKA